MGMNGKLMNIPWHQQPPAALAASRRASAKRYQTQADWARQQDRIRHGLGMGRLAVSMETLAARLMSEAKVLDVLASQGRPSVDLGQELRRLRDQGEIPETLFVDGRSPILIR